MAASRKTEIIEVLFNSRWDEQSENLSDPLVTLEDVSREIKRMNQRAGKQLLSDRNPANFFKDFIRNKTSANRNWPASVFEHGYTARQETGGNACFRFVEAGADQEEPFYVGRVPAPSPDTPRYRIQSASMPIASRRLGRTDEQWLIQVVTRLKLVETHLAVFSHHNAVQVDHLQSSIKLSRTEIDSLYLALVADDGAEGVTSEVLVTCEAKGPRDDILEEQVARQVEAIFSVGVFDQARVIPVALKVVGKSLVHLVEFDAIDRGQFLDVESLNVAKAVIYEFSPPVPGIGG
jgi:hypothetical protein